MRRKVVIGLLLAVLLAAFFWFYNHAYAEITVQGADGKAVAYTLRNQKSGKTVEFSSSDSVVRKLLARGSYEVLARANEHSHFSVINVRGFLGKTAVKATLAPEKSRKFIGDNPAPCMHYNGQTLVSFGCGSSYGDIRQHVPATATLPTFVRKPSGIIYGDIEGTVTTTEGSFMLIKAPAEDEDQGAPHTLYPLTDNLELQNGTALLDLDEDKTYSMQAYKQGFLVYDNAYESVYHYPSVKAKPSSVNIDKPQDEQLKPYALSARGEVIVMAFSNNTEGEVADIHDTTSTKIKNEVVVREEGKTRRFTFKNQYAAVRLCGNSKLCLLHGDRLEVYDISGDKQTFLYSVSDVRTVENSGNGLLVVREKFVIYLNIDSRQGYIHYSLGDYGFCGIQNESGGYVLCLINSKNDKVALFVDQRADNMGSIDKKVAELLKVPQVKDLSVYDRFIYVSPETGELVYDQAAGGFVPEPATLAAANQAINQAVVRLGIDRSVYTVINAFE